MLEPLSDGNSIIKLQGQSGPIKLVFYPERDEDALKLSSNSSATGLQDAALSYVPEMNVQQAYPLSLQDKTSEEKISLTSTSVQTDKDLIRTLITKTKKDASVHTQTTGAGQITTRSVASQNNGPVTQSAFVQTHVASSETSSQTEDVVLVSIEKECDVSTQTGQRSSVATETNPNVSVVDRSFMVDESSDTQDLQRPQEFFTAKKDREEIDVEKLREFLEGQIKDVTEMILNKIIKTDILTPKLTHHPCQYFKQNRSTSSTLQTSQTNVDWMKVINSFKLLDDLEKNSQPVEKHNLTIHNCDQKLNVKKQVTERITKSGAVQNIKTPKEDVQNFIKDSEEIVDDSHLEIAKPLSSSSSSESISAVAIKSILHKEVTEALKTPLVIERVFNTENLPEETFTRLTINPIYIADSKTPKAAVKVVKKPSRILVLRRSSSILKFKDDIDEIEDTRNLVKEQSEEMVNIQSKDVPHSTNTCSGCSGCCRKIRNCEKKKRPVNSPQKLLKSTESREKNKSSFASTSSAQQELERLFPGGKSHFSADYELDRKSAEYGMNNVLSTEDLDKTSSLEASGNENVKKSEEMFMNTLKNSYLDMMCKVMNDHILNRPVPENEVKKAAAILYCLWHQIASNVHATAEDVQNYIQYFTEFSNNLLQTLIHSSDIDGNTILHFAYAYNNFDVAEVLLTRGNATDLLNKPNNLGNTPVMLCAISEPASERDWIIASKTLKIGNVNAKSLKTGQTPLMNAVARDLHQMALLLLEEGADPNAQDFDGSTALMYAAEYDRKACAKALLGNRRCDSTLGDSDGKTACQIALAAGFKDLALLIHMHEKNKMTSNQIRLSPKSHQKWTQPPKRCPI